MKRSSSLMKSEAARVCSALAVPVLLCLIILSLTIVHSVSYAHKGGGNTNGAVSSSPASGPVGATIAVSGTGWSAYEGTQVSFGYMIASNCSIVPDSQIGVVKGGSFSGWFRWPQGTPLGTYTVCAMIENKLAQANTYTVLSKSGPQVTIAPTTLTPNEQATITATNYFPAGTSVNLLWASMNNQVDFSISTAPSDNNGTVKLTFPVPNANLPGGTYMIEASVGGGQPPTLFSSVNFTYNPPAHQPAPTPSPAPSSPSTHTVTPTATAAKGITPTAIPTLTPAATENPGTNQVPTSSTTGSSGGTTPASRPNSMPLLVGIVGSVMLLLALLSTLLLRRQRRGKVSSTGKANWTLTRAAALKDITPGQLAPGDGQSLLQASAGTGNSFGVRAAIGKDMQPVDLPMGYPQLQVRPYAEPQTQLPARAAPIQTVNNLTPVLVDPALEAIKQQVQLGLFATPRQPRDEKVPI